MAVTGSPSHSQPEQHNDDNDEDVQNQDPIPIQSQEAEQSTTQQPPNSETLDLPNPQQSPLHDEGVQNPQKLDKEEDEDTLLTHDGDDQQSQQKDDHQTGMTIATIPEETKYLAPPPLTSPTNHQRRFSKRKKPARLNPHKRKKVQNLTDNLKPIPFTPKKTLDFVKHEEVLKRLGLHEFSKIEFNRSIKTDLVAQLIVNYDQKKRASYVNDLRISVTKPDLARALKLPKSEKGSSSTVEEVDLDSEVFSDEAIEFIDDFVSNWILLHEDSWVVPPDLVKMTRCIKDGHPEKLDPARLIWHMVEKELTQGDKLVDCYYASHLQYLIRSQRDEFFMEEDEGVANGIPDDVEEIEEKEEEEEKQKEEEEEKQKEEEEEKQKEEEEEKQMNEEKDMIVEEQGIELTLGTDVKEIVQEDVKKDDEVMVDAEECKEEEEEEEEEDVEAQGNWLMNGKNEMGNHFLQRCHSDLNSYEEQKVEELEDDDELEHEQIQHVEDEEEEEEEECGERADEGFDMGANDDSLDRDGLTDNFLQGVEASHNAFGAMDLFGSRDGSFMSHGGPSSFFNGGKRVMEAEEHMNHHDQNHKRLKTDEIWSQNPTDMRTCMAQMQQLMDKAKMIYESKEQTFENSQYNNQLAINQLQERQNYMEMVMKSKDEELAKKHTEVFRLERELYLMGDLVAGYRKALNDTRFRFSEYRKRYALFEEPLYKDAGPGGLVLSTRELEKQRVKQEEDRVKAVKMVKDFEEEWVCKFEMHPGKVLMMADKLVSIENEVKNLKGMSMQRKVTRDEPELSVEPEEKRELLDEGELLAEPEADQKSMEEQEMSVEPEADQKSMEEQEMSVEPEADQKVPDEVVENDENVESIPLDADESKEKGGGED